MAISTPWLSRWRRKSAVLSSVCVALLWGSALPVAQAASGKTAADYFVHSLPGAPDGPLLKMHAGHVEVTPEHHGNLFFWHYQNRHLADRPRTVIWLNGGPGCSSEDGGLMEIGPYRVGEGGKLSYNNGSWDEFANVLFVDNPVGTGFSYADTNAYVHELKDMADQFVTFLEKWFALFPEYMHDDIYMAGESYAGQHIPYIARAMLDRNKVPGKDAWNLKGLLIGNGWISPVDQYLSYAPFAKQMGLLPDGSDAAKAVDAQQSRCIQKLNEGGKDKVDTPVCEDILQEILDVSQEKTSAMSCVNMYDVRLRDTYPSCGMNWPPDLAAVTPYLRQPDVVRALHIDPDKKTGWTECNGQVGQAFSAVNSAPSVTLLPGLLKELNIILFSGDQDMICNHLGTEELIHNLKWNGGTGFELSSGTWAPRRDWTFESEAAGYWQEARNLTYIVFYNSSHMVPFDYPRRTRDMLDRFMGVDIAAIGGEPTDSRIDGEKGPMTSVGDHPNSTAAQEAEQQKLDEATWRAYYKSGEVALVVVIIAVSVWGYFIWRDRRRRAGYTGLFGGSNGRVSLGGRENMRNGMGLSAFRNKHSQRDVEAADFDEAELDDLADERNRDRDMERDHYDIGGESDTEGSDVVVGKKGSNGTGR